MTTDTFDAGAYRLAFGAAIEARRRSCGLTRADLAAKVGWTLLQIRDRETGRSSVRVEDAAAIAAALNIPLAYLLPPVLTPLERVAQRAGD